MTSKELRIGNLVLLNNPISWKDLKNVPMKVKGIGFNPNPLDGINETITVEKINKSKYEIQDDYSQFAQFIEPIPLTEEWLLKFGFKKKSWLSEGIVIEVTYYQLSNFIIYLLKDTFEVELIRKGDNKQFNLFINFDKKVHILQNLYFALTGLELNIKNE